MPLGLVPYVETLLPSGRAVSWDTKFQVPRSCVVRGSCPPVIAIPSMRDTNTPFGILANEAEGRSRRLTRDGGFGNFVAPVSSQLGLVLKRLVARLRARF